MLSLPQHTPPKHLSEPTKIFHPHTYTPSHLGKYPASCNQRGRSNDQISAWPAILALLFLNLLVPRRPPRAPRTSPRWSRTSRATWETKLRHLRLRSSFTSSLHSPRARSKHSPSSYTLLQGTPVSSRPSKNQTRSLVRQDFWSLLRVPGG